MTLQALPTEILVEVTRALKRAAGIESNQQGNHYTRSKSIHRSPAERDCQRWLLALSRTCRRLYVIATPHLYEDFHVRHPGKLVQYFRTIVTSPQLARHVRNFRLDIRYMYGVQTEGILLPADWMLVRSLIESLSTTIRDQDPDVWYRAISSHEWGAHAMIAVLCSLMSNLENLHLSIAADYCRYLRRVMMRARDSQKEGKALLDKYSTVHLELAECSGESAMEIAVAFAQPASVRSFSIEGWDPRSAPPVGTILPITNLEFKHCQLDTHVLASFVACCPNLESLSMSKACLLEVNVGNGTDDDCTQINLVHVLSKAKETLRELRLWKCGCSQDGDGLSLIGFGALTDVTITQDYLFRDGIYNASNLVDFVPESIENLTITNAHSSAAVQVYHLLENLPTVAPKLNTVRIVPSRNTGVSEALSKVVEGLKLEDFCAEKAITLIIDSNRP